MLIDSTKKLIIALFLLITLVACSRNELNGDILIDDSDFLRSDSGIYLDTAVTEQKVIRTESDNSIHPDTTADIAEQIAVSAESENDICMGDVTRLNNLALSFGDYLYISSMHNKLVFWDKDSYGNYHSWEIEREFFPIATRIYSIFKYDDKIVGICRNREGEEGIIVYNSDLSVYRSKEHDSFFSSKYLHNNLLYGFNYSSTSELSAIKSINLDSLEFEEIYLYETPRNIDFIIGSNGKIIIAEYLEGSITQYSEYIDGVLTPIFETKPSTPILYDSRGIFYLEFKNTTSERNLMLWNGNESIKISSIRDDDMNPWVFRFGDSGNIIILDDFFISIHYSIHYGAEDPYLLIQGLNSSNSKRVPLKKWDFTEADIERNGETFAGI